MKVVHTRKKRFKKTVIEGNEIELIDRLIKVYKKKFGTNATLEKIELEFNHKKEITAIVDPFMERVNSYRATFNGHLPL